MASYDEEKAFGNLPGKPPVIHEVGQIVDMLSVSELQERIDMLRAEIARLEADPLSPPARRLREHIVRSLE